MVFSREAGQRRPLRRPEGNAVKHLRQLGKIQIRIEESIAEDMPNRGETSVTHAPHVERTVHAATSDAASSPTPSLFATARALTTPSS